MALVLALAGSALLYTSCTKDYAPDILEVQKKVDQVNSDLQTALNTLEGVKSDISGLKSTDADLQKQIDETNTAIDDAIKTLNKAIADGDKDVKDYVDSKIADVRKELGDLKDELLDKIGDLAEQHDIDIDELWDALDQLKLDHDADIEDLQDQIDDINDAIDDLADDLADLKDAHDKDVKDLQGKIDDINDEIDDINDAIEALGDDIDALDGRVDTLEGDVADLKEDLAGVKEDLADLSDALDDLKEDLQGQIDDLDEKIDDAVKDLDQKIENVTVSLGKLAEQHAKDLDALKTDLEGQIGAVNDDVQEIINTDLPAIYDAIKNLEEADQTLGDLFATYAKFIQSIAYVPAWSDGWVGARTYRFTDGSYSDTLLVATFKVTPAEAAARVTMSSANIVAVATKDAAAAPDTLKITKLVNRDDAPGFVDVYAVLDGFKPISSDDEFAIFLAVEQEENTLLESVTSDYAPAWLKAENELWFQIFDGDVDELLTEDPYCEEPVRVSPSSESDSVRVLTEGRWIVKAGVMDEYFTPAELMELLNAPSIDLVSPLPGDTLTDCYFVDDAKTYSDNANGFDITIWPTRPKTIVDILTDDDPTNNQHFADVWLGNSHMEAPVPSIGLVTGTYFAVPDTVAFDMVPAEAVSIPWDYKYWDNIADTTIAKVAVPDGYAEKIADADTTLNVNTESEINYTEGVADIKKVDASHVDAEIVSSAPYGDADSTYTYTAEKFFKGNATEYVGTFDYVVEARPADLVLEYALPDTCIRFEKKTWWNLPFVADILAKQPEYLLNGKYEEDDVMNDIAKTLKPKFDKLVVKFDGEEISWDGYGFSIAADGCDFGFKLDKLGTYEFHLFDHAFGINYEFVLTVNVVNNAAQIAPKATFVTIDNAETKDYSVQVKGDYNEDFHYYLIDQHLKDYLKVIDYAEDSDSLILASALATPEAEGLVKEPLVKNNPTALERLQENPEVANLLQKHTYQWAEYDSLQFKVAATLIPYANQDYVVDSATVRLWTVDPIPVFNGGKGVTALHEKDQYAVADLFSALTVQDLNGYDLVGKVGDTYKLLTPDGITVFDYDQVLTVGDPELVSGVDYIEEVRLEVVNGSILRLKLNQGTIVEPIVVKVPITLTYMLDQGLEDKNTVYVYVTFQEK